MKKTLLSIVVLLLFTLASFSQEEIEKRIGARPIEVSNDRGAGNIDCRCNNNLLKDGGFENVTNYTGSSNISSSSAPWKPNTGTPQWGATLIGCNKGMVQMWGNKTVGESIVQNGLSFVSGRTYTIKVTARFAIPSTLSSFVRLRIAAFNGTGTTTYNPPTVIGITPNISSTSCTTFTLTWTAPGNFNSIQLHPENDYTQNDGAYISWIQVDNICIEEACKIVDEKCDPQFTSSPLAVNSQGNIVINVNPVVTAGALHYWGATYATGVNDNTPIPVATILSGGTFGLMINSTGTVTQLGTGIGITASTSGYGYRYEGFSLGRCFKVTHYIKCCTKWFSKTTTYCTKLCQETKESNLIELSVEEAKKADAVLAGQGRG